MKKVLISLLITVSLVAMEKHDFAYESAINTTQTEGLIRFEIPVDLYDNITSYRLEDVAVFDAQGDPMPQSIEGVISHNTRVTSKALPFARLPEPTQKSSDLLEVVINNKSVKLTTQKPLEKSSYIIDSSVMKDGIDYLMVRSDADVYMVGVNVSKSRDLKRWRVLAYDERLAKLSMQKSAVLKERIDLNTAATPYLLIESTQDFVISTIIAYKHQTAYEEEAREKLSYTRENNAITFELPHFVYLKSLFFTLPDSDQMYQLKVTAQKDIEAKAVVVAQGDIYSIEAGKIRKEEIAVGSYGKFYRIKALNNSYLPQELSLHYTRERKRLTFLAQGVAPYILRYGSLKRRVTNSDLNAFRSSTKGASVSIGKATLQDPEALDVEVKPKKESAFLVWLALFIGVGLLSFMSYRLIKERKVEDEIDDQAR